MSVCGCCTIALQMWRKLNKMGGKWLKIPRTGCRVGALSRRSMAPITSDGPVQAVALTPKAFANFKSRVVASLQPWLASLLRR